MPGYRDEEGISRPRSAAVQEVTPPCVEDPSSSSTNPSRRKKTKKTSSKYRIPCCKAISEKVKWVKNRIQKKEILKCYFSFLFTFPKSILFFSLVFCLVIGTVGLLTREYYRDIHKLYAMKNNPEMKSYDLNHKLWNDSTTDFMMIIEPIDPTVDVWNPKALHFGAWVDATVRHLSVNSYTARNLETLGDHTAKIGARDLIQQYLSSSVPEYDPGKHMCDCPACQDTCISNRGRAEKFDEPVVKSSNLTHSFRSQETSNTVRVTFKENCVQNYFLRANVIAFGMFDGYACVAMTPFSLMVDVSDMEDLFSPGSTYDSRHFDEKNDYSSMIVHDKNLVLGSAYEYSQASALGFFYKLKSPETDTEVKENQAIQMLLEVLIEELPNHLINGLEPEYTVKSRSSRSLQDAVDSSTALDAEMKLRLGIAIVAVSTVLLWGIGLNKTVIRVYHTKIRKIVISTNEIEPDSPVYLCYIGFLAMISIVSSGFGASGLLYLFGLPHVPASESIPFMILGIGVDDFFVIWNAYKQTYQGSKYYSPEYRVLKAYQNTYNSITLSTSTTVISFLIGCIGPFWHIQVYSANVAFCLCFLYISCWVMIPIVILKHARRHEGEATQQFENEDPMVVLREQFPAGKDQRMLQDLDFADKEVLIRGQLWWNGPGEQSGHRESIPRSKLWLHQYALMLLQPTVKAIVVAIAGITTLVCVGLIVFELKLGLALEDATPFSSPLRSYLNAQATHFSNYGDEFDVTVILPTPLIEAAPAELFELIDHWEKTICQNTGQGLDVGYCHSPVIEHIMSQIEDDGSMTTDEFYESFRRVSINKINPMNALIYTKGTAFINYLAQGFNQSVTKYQIYYRLKIVVPVMKDTAESWKWYTKLQTRADWLGESIKNMAKVKLIGKRCATPKIVISSQLLPMWAADSSIHLITATSLVTALASVTACSYFLLGRSPIQALLIFYCMVLIDIHLVGIMILLGGTLNLLTMITLLMAQGFSVDYLAHMSHSFAHSKLKNSVLRVQSAILGIGTSIVQSSATTFAALCCLVLSDKYTLRVFCRMVISTIICAFLFSMVYFPILLSFVHPKHLPAGRKMRKERGKLLNVDSDLNMTERILVPVNYAPRVAYQKDQHKFEPASSIVFLTASPPRYDE